MNQTLANRMSPELRKRVLTGVFGGVALVLVIIKGGWIGMFLLSAGLSLAMTQEFATILFSLPDKAEKSYALLCIAWFSAIINLFASRNEFELIVTSFLSLFTYYLLTARRYHGPELLLHFRELMASLFGLLYLTYLPFYLNRIHDQPNGVQWTILFLLIVWSGDTGAYFVGKKYGRRRLYPEISPKKSVEGAQGGIALSIIVTLLFKLIFFRELHWLAILVIPAFVGTAAILGDLCESFFKRAFDVKDSGRILPGHGGFLDRFDSVVFSLPVMYALVRVFG
jgi:phosphatidate cytidylyltransferase